MKTELIWHSGPLPHVGWWNASTNRDKNRWRWWDGKAWSFDAEPIDSDYRAADRARLHTDMPQHTIEWTHYYPDNARVPRLNPDHSSCIYDGKVWAWIGGELVCGPMLQQPEQPKLLPEAYTLAKRLREIATQLQYDPSGCWGAEVVGPLVRAAKMLEGK